MTAPLDDAIGWLRAQRAGMTGLLGRLVRENSHTGNPAGVARVADLVEPELRRLGLAVERVQPEGFGPHLFFRGPAPGRPAFLVGHLDTVFPPGAFEGFEVDGDTARGPGVFDMKGGVVLLLHVLEALGRAGLLARLPVAGALVSDEEVGSPSSQPLLRERAAGAACGLVLESGRAGDVVVTRRKGGATLHVTAHGVAAHAGNEHEKGRNAIWALSRFVNLAQLATDHARGLTVNVGTIRGGTTKNTVPDLAECEVDLRFPTAADGAALVAGLEASAEAAALEGTRLEVRRASWRDPLQRTEASAALAARYAECARASGLGTGEAPVVGGGSDGCTLGSAGVPTIDSLGPRGRGFHTREEQVDLASFAPKGEAILRLLVEIMDP
jgi:glutamate carboxypeptidase